MEKDALRLECLKLACAKTVNQQEILAKAQEYVAFVSDTLRPNMAEKPAPNVGNTKPL